MSDNQKKTLASLIKADLKKEIEKLEKEGEIKRFKMCGIRDDGSFFIHLPKKALGDGNGKVYDKKADYFEKDDYQEIVNLIRQLEETQKKIGDKWEQDVDNKLASNKKLFHWCSMGWSGEPGAKGYHRFEREENGLTWLVSVHEDHPALTNVPLHYQDKRYGKTKTFYLIEGVERPAEPIKPAGYVGSPYYYQRIGKGGNITITPCHNNSEPREKNNKIVGICNKCGADYRGIESWYYPPLEEDKKEAWDKLSWFCGECWKTEEKKYRQKSSLKNTAHKSEPQKNNLGDEHYYYFDNGSGHWISLESGTPDPNTTNSEGKVSRLVTLVDFIQPPSEGKDRGNWDYFHYVFATENGERFEINSLNPAIGFDAGTKKGHFQRAGHNGVRFWYKISWNSAEPDKQKFGKEDFIEIEKWEKNSSNSNIGSQGNKKNDIDKKLSISIIREFFREWNVKSIEITSSGDLFVEYNNGSNEVIKNDEKGTGIIKNNLKRVLNKEKLNQQELEKLQNGSSSHQPPSPKSGYTPYLIGGGIVAIILGGILISYYLIQRKRKK